MTIYTASNGAIIADLTTLKAIPSTNLPTTGFVILFVAFENSWYEYNSALTSGDIIPINNPSSGRWIRIGRDKLTANRTYYVRTDGSDSNNGLANTSGGAFLTIPKAIDVVASLDISIYDPTIQVADGTYNQQLFLKPVVGAGTVFITGNILNPQNVIITAPTFPTIDSSTNSLYDIKGFTINCADTAYKICIASDNGNIRFGNIIFPSLTGGGYHLSSSGASAKIEASANYQISGSADIHAIAGSGGFITVRGKTITLIGSPAIGFFVRATVTGMIDFVSNTYSGSATGVQYIAALNGVVFTNGATLPGNSAGIISTGGQFG